MRMFQVLLLTLLVVITFELGLLIVKLPIPAVQATVPSSTYIPEDPHETLKRQLTDVTRRLGTIEQRLASDSRRLLGMCAMVYPITEKYPGDFDSAIKRCTAQGWSAVALNKFNNFDLPFGP